MTRGLRTVGFGVAAALSSCASAYVASADREGAAIEREKRGVVERFRATELLDPRGDLPSRTPEPAGFEVPPVITAEDALRIATRHNREYLAQREGIFLSALSLGLVRRDFTRMVFDGSLAYSGTVPRDGATTDATTLSVSGSQLLPTGTRLAVSAASSLSHGEGADGRDQSASLSGSVSLVHPLLRGGRRWIVFEPLTQAEREMVYTARSFEEFRQGFAIDVLQRYYSIVSQARQLANIRKRVANQEYTVLLARARYELGEESQLDVFLAEQSLADARNAVLDAEQGYQLALDRFKIFLGLPTDVKLELADELPAPEAFDLDTERAVAAALHNRLDLRTARDRLEDAQRALAIARNNLLPNLDLSASYTIASDAANSFNDLAFSSDSFGFGATLEIPLDRKAERNSYRAALINLERARRALDQQEDGVILEIRDALRGLRRQRSQIEIEEGNIRTLKRRVVQAEFETLAGQRTNRDVVEALDGLTAAENAQLDRQVSLEISRLHLLQALGLLFVEEDGRIVR